MTSRVFPEGRVKFGAMRGMAAVSVVALTLQSSGCLAQGLSAVDIQQSLSGKRVSLSCVDGTSGSGRYTMAENFGIITGSYKRPGADLANDVGRVRADGERLCLKFKLLNNGEEQCFGVRSTGGGRFAFTVGGGLIDACQVVPL